MVLLFIPVIFVEEDAKFMTEFIPVINETYYICKSVVPNPPIKEF